MCGALRKFFFVKMCNCDIYLVVPVKAVVVLTSNSICIRSKDVRIPTLWVVI